ncbi:MAG: DUF2062 domain-containing protein [Chromatiaceae bacterium]|nr:DUF2062 domain-containing protein [Chromatiaceae bacterium]
MKQWLKRITPNRAEIREHKHLRVFGKLLQDPNLWHLNRRSASGAVAVGMFVMYLPPLGQMLIAAGGAIAFRVNLPISVALVWITNPVTIPPMYYFAYLVGSWILSTPAQTFALEYWLEWHNWLNLLAPMTVGCLVCGIVCSALGYLSVQAVWRWNLARQIRMRRARYRAATSGVNTPSSKSHT